MYGNVHKLREGQIKRQNGGNLFVRDSVLPPHFQTMQIICINIYIYTYRTICIWYCTILLVS